MEKVTGMSTYVIDWDGAAPGTADDVNLDGTTAISNGTGHDVNVTVSTPAGGTGYGEEWKLAPGTGGSDGELYAVGVDDPTMVSVEFDTAMTNITFEIYDIDSGDDWDDSIQVYALDINGNPVATSIVVTNTTSNHVVTSDGTTTTIDANGNVSPGVEGSGAPDTVTITIAGPVYGFVVVYDNGTSAPGSGVVGIGPVTFFDPTVWCFARGTMIETNRGEVAIEDLLAGDMVRTADSGFQPLRWIGSTSVKAKGSKAPILFRKGTIGNTRDLLLSPAHRVVLQDWQAEVLFGTGELLASAQSLVNDSTIVRQETGENVDYFHVLFDKHEIIFSEGAATESFHPGDVNAGALAQEARAEIFELFPELEHNQASYGPSARETLRPHEAALLKL